MNILRVLYKALSIVMIASLLLSFMVIWARNEIFTWPELTIYSIFHCAGIYGWLYNFKQIDKSFLFNKEKE